MKLLIPNFMEEFFFITELLEMRFCSRANLRSDTDALGEPGFTQWPHVPALVGLHPAASCSTGLML